MQKWLSMMGVLLSWLVTACTSVEQTRFDVSAYHAALQQACVENGGPDADAGKYHTLMELSAICNGHAEHLLRVISKQYNRHNSAGDCRQFTCQQRYYTGATARFINDYYCLLYTSDAADE